MRRRPFIVDSLTLLGTVVLISGSLNFFAAFASASTSVSGLDSPDAIAVTTTDVWVANFLGNSVSEYNSKTGSLVRVIDAKADGFHRPDGIAVSGTHVWVSNGNRELGMGTLDYPLARYSSVTELNATNGSLVRVIKAPADHLVEPGPIVVSGSNVWVVNLNATANADSSSAVTLVELSAADGSLEHLYTANQDGLSGVLNLTATKSDVWLTNAVGAEGSVVELNAQSGSLVRIIKAKKDALIAPGPISVDGSHVWIANIRTRKNSVVELNSKSGSLVRVINTPADDFNGLLGIATNGSRVWTTNSKGASSGGTTNSVVELNAGTGALVRIINAKADGLNGPSDIVVENSKLWVLNAESITELNAVDGSLVRVIK